jgi:malate dehydrogenase (oxaloacetate-decarboxylating)(NADP+)
MLIRRQEALDYHSQGRPGKIQVSPTKPFKNQRDLSLAYTPGVAEPCREITARPEEAYTYTANGNLVAVVTNGTAVLGLGNIGALAGKPVMEGKGILFKAFADICELRLGAPPQRRQSATGRGPAARACADARGRRRDAG